MLPAAAFAAEPERHEEKAATSSVEQQSDASESPSLIKEDASDSPSSSFISTDKALCEPKAETVLADFPVKSVDGTTTQFCSDYGGRQRIIVMGRSACENTTKAVETLEKLLSQKEYADVQGFVFCLEADDEKVFAEKHKDSGTENLVFAADGDAYHELLWSAYQQAGFDSRSVTELPYMFFVNGKNVVRSIATGDLPEQDFAAALKSLVDQASGEDATPETSAPSYEPKANDEEGEDATNDATAEVEAVNANAADPAEGESQALDEAQDGGASPLTATDEYVSGNFKYTLYDGNYAKVVGYVNKPFGRFAIPETIDGHIVETIGSDAFRDCPGITSIKFPSTLITIDGGAFRNCDGLTEVEFPSSVEAIHGGSFADCDKLSKVSLPKGGVGCFVGSGSFSDNPSLTELFIPDGLRCDTVWTGSPFSGTPISSVSFESGITSIPGNIFGRCKSLESVTIPSTVVSIGDSAFAHCTMLKEIKFPHSVEKIGAGAFYNCDSLTEVVFPKSVTVIGGDISNFNNGSFADCDNLEKITLPQGGEGCLLGGNAFSNDPKLKSVFIPKGISCDTYWYFGAFPNSGLESVTFETGIEAIPWNLFKNCTALSKIAIPSTVKTIEGNAFSGCSSLISVSLPTGLQKIAENAFESCKRLPSIMFPDSLTEIGSKAFSDCEKLSSVKLPRNTGKGCTLNKRAFSGCTRLTTIHIPATLSTSAPALQTSDPFAESGITSVTFDDGIEAIPDGLFGSCTSLASISLPNTIKTIGHDAFGDCAALTSINLSTSLEKIGNSAFEGCERLTSISVPENASAIGSYAFANCPKLEKVRIPFNVAEIGRNAFSNSPKASIEGYQTSYAETYAKQNSIPFISLPLPREMKYTVVASIGAQSYTGSALTPNPKVTFEGKTLLKGTDYTVSYKNNVGKGTASMTIAGKGSYTGSKTLTFEIVAADVTKTTIVAIPNQTFTGKHLAPKPVVKLGGKKLKEGTDYAISYKNNVNVGTAALTIAGKGNYAGSKATTFKIVAATVAKAAISAIPDQIYTGKTITPKPVLKVGGLTLKEGRDYTLSYRNNVKAGTATVVVSGKGNYTGSKTTGFKIVEKATPPAPTPTPNPAPSVTAPRLSGDTALDTMASITKQGFAAGSCSTVVVATMGGYWDALSASALAGLNNCPILLTDGSALSTQAAAEIKRLKPSKVYIAGGTAAISSGVERSLKSITGVKTVKRLAGDIAVNTALEIYQEGKGSWGTTAIVATSETFQDALSVSPYAYAKHAPIFLANAFTHKLDSNVLSELKAGGFKRVIIVGGTAALSDQLEKQQLKGISCKRLAGPTAYETSGAIAKWCLTQGMTASNVGVATGDSYYDALAGAALCGKNNSALVLVADDYRFNITGFIAPNKRAVDRVYVFGGPAAVSNATYNSIKAALK